MRSQSNLEPGISHTMFLGAVTLGIYGSDLHKLLLNVFSFALGQPLVFIVHGRLADVIMVILLTFFTIIILIKNPERLQALFNIPSSLMVLMGLIATFSLLSYYDPISSEWYYRFISGNLLLFICAAVICSTPRSFNLVLMIWLVTSVIMALSAIYLTIIGITWSSGRSLLIQGVGIRTGYFCALSVICMVSILLFKSERHRHNLLFIPMMLILVLGCMVSGSKASILLMILGILVLFLMKFMRFRNLVIGKSIAMISILALAVVIFTSLVTILSETGFDTGFLSQDLDYLSYLDAFRIRLDLALDYLDLGCKHLILGNGISSAYSLDMRTHSAFTSFFVQFGLLGSVTYLFWLASLLLIASMIVFSPDFTFLPRSYIFVTITGFISVVFLAMKAEITGDVPGNRELWMFSGMLLALVTIKNNIFLYIFDH